MASRGVTGIPEEEIEDWREKHKQNNQYLKRGIDFETAFCLRKIPRQPDDYEGPPRYCIKRVGKLTRKQWNELYPDRPFKEHDEDSYLATCKSHGAANVGGTPENLENPRTAHLKHGLYAKDESLQMDFTDAERTLYEAVIEQWPEIYDWPSEDEDPARYEILDMAATNFVRRRRAEDYIDSEGEVHMRSVYEDGIEVGQEPEENPISGEYRLLMREITQMLKELGLTPKEQAKLGAEQQSANAMENIGEAVNEAILGEQEYDPEQFDDEDSTTEFQS